MDLNNQPIDPHGVQALLARLRQQQDAVAASTSSSFSSFPSSSSSFATTSAAAPSATPSYTYPGLADSYAPYTGDTTPVPTAPVRRIYNVQPRYGNGYHDQNEGGYDPYGYTPYAPSDADAGAKKQECEVAGEEQAQASTTKLTAKPTTPGQASTADSSNRSATASEQRSSSTSTEKPAALQPSIAAPPASAPTAEELRDLTFSSALPYLTKLASSPSFLTSLSRLKQSQDDLERSLHTSYLGFQKTLRPTLHPTTRRYEEAKFLRALKSKWSENVAKQQRELQKLGVPCCFETEDRARWKRQRRVVEVLEGMLEE
ncbi:hypothetical protein ACQY0O_000836 [Thecaphora frezii]